jgi:hypothetical protein
MTFLGRIYALVVHSPANAFVTDPLGRSIGTDPETGIVVNEIPDALYSGPSTEPQLVLIFDPVNGTYNIALIGTANGNYTLTIEYITETQTTEQALNGTIVAGQTQAFTAEISGTTTTLYMCANIDVNPDSLNLRSKGTWITAYIEFPEGFDVNNINVSSILLNNTIPVALSAPATIDDYDNDGIPDLMVKFDRTAVIQYILAHVNMTELIEEGSMTITLTITGKLEDGTPFKGTDTIRIILPMFGRMGHFVI